MNERHRPKAGCARCCPVARCVHRDSDRAERHGSAGNRSAFERFRADDMECRQDAQYQIGGKTAGAVRESAITSAAVGTAVGALAGAAIGGDSKGAAIGARAPVCSWAVPPVPMPHAPRPSAPSASTTTPISSACTPGPPCTGPRQYQVIRRRCARRCKPSRRTRLFRRRRRGNTTGTTASVLIHQLSSKRAAPKRAALWQSEERTVVSGGDAGAMRLLILAQ